MFGFSKKQTFPIGIDISKDNLKIVQLGKNDRNISLVAGVSENRPVDIQPDSSDWQKWTIEMLAELVSKNGFQGKQVVAAMPTADVYVDYLKMPKTAEKDLQSAVFSKIRQKLPFESNQNNTMLKFIPTEENNVLVMAMERTKIDRHLAVYEKAGLAIKSISVWPMALVNCYTGFFGRRKSDFNSIVMLVSIEPDYTKVLICRHSNLLFARSIPIGLSQLEDEAALTRLVMELTTSRRQYISSNRNAQIERLIFLSTRNEDRDMCVSIAKQMEIPAQVGDCLAAVEIDSSIDIKSDPTNRLGIPIDRRDCRLNWTTAFGLSLS